MASLFSIDAHAGGGMCRVVFAGFPALRGVDAVERQVFVRQRLDWIRTSLMHPPRGHASAFGALLGPPVRATSAYSLIFFDPTGYLSGCGHGTLCSVAVWRRMMGDVEVPFDIDNPDGSVTRVVSLTGTGEFCTATIWMHGATISDEQIELPWGGGVAASIARCGNLYLLVEAERLGATPERRFNKHARRDRILAELRDAAHGLEGTELKELQGIVVYQRLESEAVYETTVLFNGTQIDLSPCGTGSGALACLLLRRSEIAAGQWIETYGPTRLAFSTAARPRPADADGYQVSIRGTAHITGAHEWIVSDEDPLRAGLPPHAHSRPGASHASP